MNKSTSKVQKGDGRLTSGMTKLMAISSRGRGEIEDLEDWWRRPLLEFLEFPSMPPPGRWI